MRLTSTGLGIGTTLPGYRLQVDGASTAGFVTSIVAKNPSTNAASSVKIGFDAGGTIWGEIGASYNTNDPYMAFFVRSGSEKIRITDAGNLGLGVVPSAWTTGDSVRALQMSGGAFFVYGGNSVWVGQNMHISASLGNTYTANGAASNYTQAAGAHYWNTAPSGTAGNAISFTQAMTLGTNSGLSIGTTTAAAANGLLVAGAATFSSDVKVNSGTDAIDIGTATGNSYRSNLILRGTNASGVSSIAYLGINVFSTDGSVDLVSDNNLIFRASGSTERLRITSGGNVGIGTTAPTSQLQLGIGNGIRLNTVGSDVFPTITNNPLVNSGEIYGSGGVGSDYGSLILSAGGGTSLNRKMSVVLKGYGSTDEAQIRMLSGNTALMTLLYTGNVGIGTTSPAAKLEIVDGDGQKLQIDGNEIYHVTDSPFYIKSLGDIVFQPDGTTQVTIKESGNFLIGTTTDIGTKLHVSGTTYTAGLSVNASAFSGNVTLSTGTSYIYIGTGGHTFTLQSASGSNQIYIVKNASSSSLSIATTGGQTIIDNAGAATSTFTLAANKAMIIQQDGGTKNYIMSIY